MTALPKGRPTLKAGLFREVYFREGLKFTGSQLDSLIFIKSLFKVLKHAPRGCFYSDLLPLLHITRHLDRAGNNGMRGVERT
jgi:hypothetical protein